MAWNKIATSLLISLFCIAIIEPWLIKVINKAVGIINKGLLKAINETVKALNPKPFEKPLNTLW